MDIVETKFKKGILFSSVVIALFLLFCISEMIVSWCVDYSYYSLDFRVVAAVCLFVLAIVFACNHKRICLFPTFVCCALLFAILIDFFTYRSESVFLAQNTNVNNIKVFPFIIHFEKYRDLSHPQNHWATTDDLDFVGINIVTIIFAVALLIGGLLFAMWLAVKSNKLNVLQSNRVLFGTTMGMTILGFVEFMRCIMVLISIK